FDPWTGARLRRSRSDGGPSYRTTSPPAIPFPIAHHAAARQNAPLNGEVVLYEGPPSARERRSRAPVHGSKPHPIFRHFERLDNVPLGIPAIKERPHGDRPVAIEPSAHEFLAAGSPQPLLIRLHIDVPVVVDPARNKYPF